jgi:hypothetical protein
MSAISGVALAMRKSDILQVEEEILRIIRIQPRLLVVD